MSKLGYILTAVGSSAITFAITYKVMHESYKKKLIEDILEAKKVMASPSEFTASGFIDVAEHYSKGLSEGIKNVNENTAEVAKEFAFKLVREYNTETEETPKSVSFLNVNAGPFDKPYELDDVSEFGEYEDYDCITLRYYTDGALVEDTYDDEVESIEDTIGVDNYEKLKSMSLENGEDILYVRNDRLKCDFEVLIDETSYSEVKKGKPKPIRLNE